MLEVVNLFREKGTLDELGFGTIRDAFADHFFPGTSTIQTRVRYFLFIPWIYLKLEQERVASAHVDQQARRWQAQLAQSLGRGGEGDAAGVIGIQAGERLQRPPSVVYWGGLWRWGIRLFPGGVEQYHLSFDRSQPEAEQAAGEVALHKVGETENHITVRGARMLATLAPYADELTIYPGSDIRPQDGRYALSFAIPMATPGLKFICRDSYSKQRDPFDYPLSSRFDEMDAVAIFDDVEVPKDRVFLDGDTVGYSEVITDSGWRGHIMHQAFTRAYVKLSFAFGLGHLLANTTGVVRFDHIQEKLGRISNMVELTRSGLVSAEAGSFLDEGGVWYPDDRPFLALRGEMPRWLPSINELLQLIGGGGFMATPSRADLDGPLRADIDKYYQSAGADAERRIQLFRLAWDYVGSDLGSRGELYERFYLSDSWRMTALAYKLADKTFAESLVEQFLGDSL